MIGPRVIATRLRPFPRLFTGREGGEVVKIKRNIVRLFSALPNFVQTFTCNLKQIATSNISKTASFQRALNNTGVRLTTVVCKPADSI